MSAKNMDKHNRWRNKTVAFRVSPEEDAQIEMAVKLTGLTKQDYIIRRLLCRDVVVQGNPRVYKALRDQLAAVLDELRRIEAGQGVNDELLDTIQMIATIMNGMQEDFCIVTVHHTRKQPARDSFETISGTTGLLGCADGALLMQKKKRTALEATVDAVGRDQQDQILYLKKDADTQIWSLKRTENEPYQEPPDPVLDTVSQLVSSESREWTGSPTELAEAVNTGMAANALTKYLNVKSGRLLDEYHVRYENRAKHSGRQVKLTYMAIDNVEYEVIE